MENFGKIKNVFNTLLSESIGHKDSDNKILFKEYVKIIKNSDILRSEFYVYENLVNTNGSDSTTNQLYISEVVKVMDNFPKKDIINEHSKLVSLLGKSMDRINDDYPNKQIDESISNLIFSRNDMTKAPLMYESFNRIVNHIKLKGEKVTDKNSVINEISGLPISSIKNLMINKFNQKYSNLSKDESRVLAAYLKNDDEVKKEVRNKMINECIDLVHNHLEFSNLTESEDKLHKVKVKLYNDKASDFDVKNFISETSKLIELKNNLMNI